MPVHSRVGQYSFLHLSGEEHCEIKVPCPRTQHSIHRTTWSWVEHTTYEPTVPPTYDKQVVYWQYNNYWCQYGIKIVPFQKLFFQSFFFVIKNKLFNFNFTLGKNKNLLWVQNKCMRAPNKSYLLVTNDSSSLIWTNLIPHLNSNLKSLSYLDLGKSI